MKRRALVTGITGFIGTALARRLLADGWQVDTLVRPSSDTSAFAAKDGVTFHTVAPGADLTAAVAAARPDVVFHLASLYLAEHRPDQIGDLIGSNVLFPALLAEAMAANGVTRLVNTGTAWQNFGGADYLPVNLYAATKQAAEDLLLYYAEARGLSVVTLRLFDTYGRGDKRRKLIQLLLDTAASGEVLAMSPGDQIVDLTHVDDVVAGFVMAADRLLGAGADGRAACETFFLSGERHSVKSLSKVVAEAAGRPVPAAFGERPYRAREVMEPVSPEGRMLPGWHRRHALADYLSERAADPTDE